MALEVYLDPCTVNSRKVLAGLDFLGTQYNYNFINYFTGEHKKPEYLKINPNATVPGAVYNGQAICESNAILMFAADFGKNESAYPSDLIKRADVNSLLLWESSAWFPSCYIYLVEYVVKPLLSAEPDQSIIDAEEPKFSRLAAILETRLEKNKWLSGDQPTIADIAIAAPMHLHREQKLPLDKFPNLKRWMTEGIEKLPSWQKTQGAVEKALLPGKSTANGATNGAANGTQAGVKANFNYTKDVKELTELYFYETEKAKNIHEPGDDPHEMTVHNGWERGADSFSLDKDGFALQPFQTSYSEWSDTERVAKEFYPEVVEFLKKLVGAKEVLVFDHTIRAKANEQKKLTDEKATSQRAPVMLVHCDYTAESGPTRVKQLLKERADDLLSRRVAFLNVWKPLNTVEERPLAMCEVGSSPSDDFFKLHLRYRDRDGENYVMRHSPNHKWWYFPKMTNDKVIILKTYESETDGRARFVGHSAFEDPTSSPDAPQRESVEIRTIVFY